MRFSIFSSAPRAPGFARTFFFDFTSAFTEAFLSRRLFLSFSFPAVYDCGETSAFYELWRLSRGDLFFLIWKLLLFSTLPGLRPLQLPALASASPVRRSAKRQRYLLRIFRVRRFPINSAAPVACLRDIRGDIWLREKWTSAPNFYFLFFNIIFYVRITRLKNRKLL